MAYNLLPSPQPYAGHIRVSIGEQSLKRVVQESELEGVLETFSCLKDVGHSLKECCSDMKDVGNDVRTDGTCDPKPPSQIRAS